MTDTTWAEMLANFRRGVADAYGSHDEDTDIQVAWVIRNVLEAVLVKLAAKDLLQITQDLAEQGGERITTTMHQEVPWTHTQDSQGRVIAATYQGDPTHPRSYVNVWVGELCVAHIFGQDPNHPWSWDKRKGVTT